MATTKIDESIIIGINQGKQEAFATLYDSYFSYLCMYATTYIFNPDEAKEIVNDVFLNIWYKKERLVFPIHSYLLQSVQNGCLNYIRALKNRERVMDEYRKELLNYQEEYCANDNTPLQLLEIEDLQKQVHNVVNSLPERCRIIFEKYLYNNKSPQETAEELDISVNTVRVQIKNAMDKMKVKLGTSLGIQLLFLFQK